MSGAVDRYSNVAIALHWLIAALLIANIFVGGAMEDASRETRPVWFMRHETIGISVLVLTLVRLWWRLGHTPPPLPEGMAAWERALARSVHVLFYVVLIAIPLAGWAAASTGRSGVAPLFGTIPFFNLPLPQSRDLHEMFEAAHTTMVKATYVLIGLHVLGALKHQFVNKDGVLARMLPFLAPR